MWRGLAQDGKQAVRMLLKSPGFTLVSVLSLALAIGANATLFGLADRVLLKPMPGERHGELVSLFTSESDGARYGVTSYPAYQDLAARKDVFAHLGVQSLAPMLLTEGDRGERVLGMLVSGDWFGTLGVRAKYGRTILPADDAKPGASPVVVLSHGFWTRRFAADPTLVGRTVRINGHAWTVAGVLPESFNGVMFGITPDVCVPTAMEAWAQPGRGELDNRGGRSFMTYGILQPGITPAKAEAMLAPLARELGERYPHTDSARVFSVLSEVASRPFPNARPAVIAFLALLQGITLLVLVVACVNLAGLLLARATVRRREIGVRLALGATRGRLIRMLLAESLLLGAVGGLLGFALAHVGAGLLLKFQPPLPVPIALDITPNLRVAIFTSILSIGAGVLFGLLPALQASSPSLLPALREDGNGSRQRTRLRGGLVVTQVALSMLMLACAGLFLRALSHAAQLSPGFEPKGVTIMSFDLSLNGYDEPRARAFYARLLEDLRRSPATESAALTGSLPLTIGASSTQMWLRGGDPNGLEVSTASVSHDYFRSMRIPLLQGREFQATDTSASAASLIVNETLVRRMWPGRDPLAQVLSLSGPDGPWRAVAGVAKDSRYRQLAESPRPFLYAPAEAEDADEFTVVMRSNDSPAAALARMREAARRIDPSVTFVESGRLEEAIGVSLLPTRLASGVLMTMGSLALILACVGLFGVVAYSVSQRTKEFGVRIALGAQREDIFTLVLREGSRLAALGLGIGLLLALIAGQLLSRLLFGLSPFDPIAYFGVVALLGGASIAACALPALRATHVDPLVALRHD